jgi:hypothetical protein
VLEEPFQKLAGYVFVFAENCFLNLRELQKAVSPDDLNRAFTPNK